MSTRRTEGFEFDHGAQYFTALDPIFKSVVIKAIEDGYIAPWGTGLLNFKKKWTLEKDTGGDRFVSIPRMNSWIKAMAHGMDIKLSERITPYRTYRFI